MSKTIRNAVAYKITNNINKRCYIGVTVDFKRRVSQHKTRPNAKMIKDINAQGGYNFSTQILFKGSEEYCYSLESVAIQAYGADYNTAKGGGILNIGLSGERHPQAKLSDKEVLEIRNKYQLGTHTQKQLAEYYKISSTQISNIIRGVTWKHLKEGIQNFKPSTVITIPQKEKIQKEYLEGNILQRELALKYEISHSRLSDIIREVSIDNLKRHKVANSSKLTNTEVKELREISALGNITITLIMDIYGLSRPSASAIVDGTNYKDVGGPIKGIDYPKVRLNKQSGHWPKEEVSNG